MKKLVCCVLAMSVSLGGALPIMVQAEKLSEVGVCIERNFEPLDMYVKIKIPFPDDIKDNDSWKSVAMYKDTGEKITLSQAYDGYLWATVPKENETREISAVVPESAEFSDIDDTGDYWDVTWLSRTGVIKGNENGEAEPEREITYAEAVTMIVRFIGLENVKKTGVKSVFEDISEDDWYYDAMVTAYNCGIIDTTSLPMRSIPREKFVAMVANALEYANLRCPYNERDDVLDMDNVEDWAKKAYNLLGSAIVLDYIEGDFDGEEPKGYLYPKESVTRAYAANVLNNIDGICQNYPSDLAKSYGFDEEMPIIDGSTSTYPFTRAIYGKLFSSAYNHEDFPTKHSKTHTSYERLINGEVDMIFVSHQPASDIAQLTEEKGVELELIPIAYDAMVFFTNADNPIEGLTQEEISNLYLNNAYDNWKELGGNDAKLYAYCRNNDSGSHSQMEKYFLNGGEIHPDIKTETSYTMENVLTDVMAAKTENPLGYGLGYGIYYFFNNMDVIFNTKIELKLLAIDGVEPNDETIANGEYPLANNTYIVMRKDTPEDAPARKMAEFMLTEAGQECVENAGYGKLIK